MSQTITPQNIYGDIKTLMKNLKISEGLLADLGISENWWVEETKKQMIGIEDSSNVKSVQMAYRVISGVFYACCADDQTTKACESAYDWLSAFVKNFLVKKIESHVGIEDFTQEVLVKVFKHLQSCKQPHHFLSWVNQISIREFLQYQRKHKQELLTKLSLDELEEIEIADEELERKISRQLRAELTLKTENYTNSSYGNPQKYTLKKELIRLLIQGIEEEFKKQTSRNKTYKYILYATYFMGLTDFEVAQKLNLAVIDIQKRRSYAQARLRSNKEWLAVLKE